MKDWRWPNFTPAEMACKHCGECRMHPDFMDRLQALRIQLGFPLPVSSGYRCPAHNRRVSSTGDNGPHTTGRAVDILIHGERAVQLVGAALRFRFSGLGIGQKGSVADRIIHLDDLAPGGAHPRPRIWSY